MSDTIMRPAPAPPAAIRALTETVRGRVITASDPDYDDARAAGAVRLEGSEEPPRPSGLEPADGGRSQILQ